MGNLIIFFPYLECLFMSLTRCPHYHFNNYAVLHFMNLSLFNQFPANGQLASFQCFAVYFITIHRIALHILFVCFVIPFWSFPSDSWKISCWMKACALRNSDRYCHATFLLHTYHQCVRIMEAFVELAGWILLMVQDTFCFTSDSKILGDMSDSTVPCPGQFTGRRINP